MAGTIDIVTRAFAGMDTHTDGITFTPRLPGELRHAAFRLHHRGQRIDVSLGHDRLLLTAAAGAAASVRVDVAGATAALRPGETLEFSLADRSGA